MHCSLFGLAAQMLWKTSFMFLFCTFLNRKTGKLSKHGKNIISLLSGLVQMMQLVILLMNFAKHKTKVKLQSH